MAGRKHLLPIRPHNPESDQEIAQENVRADVKEAAQGDEDAGVQEGEDEEGRTPARVHIPHHVSQQERDDHEITHIPYRTWCRFCVQGRG